MTKNGKEDFITVMLHKEDLQTLVDFLDMTNEMYTKVVANAIEIEDKSSAAVFSARSKLASAFSNKFSQHLAIGEPESTELN